MNLNRFTGLWAIGWGIGLFATARFSPRTIDRWTSGRLDRRDTVVLTLLVGSLLIVVGLVALFTN